MNTPTITMRAFFELPEVKAQQEIQKANAHGSPAHRAAYAALLAIATRYGAQSYFPEY